MTTKKISEFQTIVGTDVLDTDFLPVLRTTDPSTSTRNKKLTASDFAEYLGTKIANPTSFPALNTIVDSDNLVVIHAQTGMQIPFSTVYSSIKSKIVANSYIDSVFNFANASTLAPSAIYRANAYVPGVVVGDFVTYSYATGNKPDADILVTVRIMEADMVEVQYQNIGSSPVSLVAHNLNLRVNKKTI